MQYIGIDNQKKKIVHMFNFWKKMTWIQPPRCSALDAKHQMRFSMKSGYSQELQYGRRNSTATTAAGESDEFHFNFD